MSKSLSSGRIQASTYELTKQISNLTNFGAFSLFELYDNYALFSVSFFLAWAFELEPKPAPTLLCFKGILSPQPWSAFFVVPEILWSNENCLFGSKPCDQILPKFACSASF